jgi:signal transduction histidine kinase
VLDALRQVLLLPDRTRTGEQSGRFRRVLVRAGVGYALVLALVGSAQYLTSDLAPWLPLMLALTVVPFALMARSPVTAWRLATVALIVDRLLITVFGSGDEAVLLQAWQWGTYVPVLLVFALAHSARVVLAATVVTAGAVVVLVALSPSPAESMSHVLSTVGLLALAALVGYAFGSRGRAQRLAVQEHEEKIALAERARIAREMHDVVAHHMSMVAVRCETAPYRITDLPDAGVREFAELAASARAAMTDMQALLGVLRSTDQPAERGPQPGLAQIPDLVRRVPEQVDLDLTETDVPEAVGLTAYRIVQEAITNASMHSPGCQVRIRLGLTGNALRVQVTNTRGGPSRGGGGGHGLAGMRERVALHGGELSASSTGDGGFEVLALLPLGEK